MALKPKLLTLALLISINTFSQERKIIGRVLDAKTQKPLKDANIIFPGTTSGTFSNLLGFFELTVDRSKHKTLIVSHVGFKTSEVLIPEEDRFKFFLESASILLDELNLKLYPRNLSNGVKSDVSKAENDNGLIVVESGASFPNGMDNFYDLIGNSLVSELPQDNEQVFNITFTINEGGQAVDVLTSDSTELVKSAVRQVFQKMPNWIPATQGQNKIPQHFILPIVSHSTPDINSLGLDDFYSFISRNIRYPAEARRIGVEGKVYVEFQIDSMGNVMRVKILKDIGADCGDEVRRIIATTPTELIQSLFKKAHFNNFILPVGFSLGGPFKKEQITQNSKALLLNEVIVTALGIERPRVSDFLPGGTRSMSISMGSLTNPTYSSLSRALEKPKSVKRLSLINNGINSFPSDIFKLNNLEFLDLERNKLQKLPNEIELLTKLQELYLFENQIERLPANFGNLKRLRILGLASNQLKSFPNELISLERLETLDLSGNQISSLPQEIGAMKNLKFLVLQNNNITSIPQEFYQLKHLEKIYIQGNPIDAKDIEKLKEVFKRAEIVF